MKYTKVGKEKILGTSVLFFYCCINKLPLIKWLTTPQIVLSYGSVNEQSGVLLTGLLSGVSRGKILASGGSFPSSSKPAKVVPLRASFPIPLTSSTFYFHFLLLLEYNECTLLKTSFWCTI